MGIISLIPRLFVGNPISLICLLGLRKTPLDIPIVVLFVTDDNSAELPLVGKSQKGGDLLFFVQETMRGPCCRYPD